MDILPFRNMPSVRLSRTSTTRPMLSAILKAQKSEEWIGSGRYRSQSPWYVAESVEDSVVDK